MYLTCGGNETLISSESVFSYVISSITMCRVNITEEKWVGMELSAREDCPPLLSDAQTGQPQSIRIPSGILVSSVPYNPVIYVTNKGMQ